MPFCQIVKHDRKAYIINLSKEYSIVTQFTSFVAIEHRDEVKMNKFLCAVLDLYEDCCT